MNVSCPKVNQKSQKTNLGNKRNHNNDGTKGNQPRGIVFSPPKPTDQKVNKSTIDKEYKKYPQPRRGLDFRPRDKPTTAKNPDHPQDNQRVSHLFHFLSPFYLFRITLFKKPRVRLRRRADGGKRGFLI